MKQRLTRSVTLVLALYLSAGYQAPVLAFANDDNGWTKSEVTADLDVHVINGCTSDDESVHLTGSILISLKTRSNADGSMDLKEVDRVTGTGIGTSGASYKLFELHHADTHLGPNPDGTPFSYLERIRQTLIGQGGVPDQRITYYIQLVIDGDGNTTVDIFDVNLECN